MQLRKELAVGALEVLQVGLQRGHLLVRGDAVFLKPVDVLIAGCELRTQRVDLAGRGVGGLLVLRDRVDALFLKPVDVLIAGSELRTQRLDLAVRGVREHHPTGNC